MTTYILNGRSTGTLSNAATDLDHPPLPGDSVNVIQGICPPGWFLPTDIHWGKMLNLVESNYLRNLPVRLDTLYGCDTLRGENATKPDYYPRFAGDSIYHFNPCMHINKNPSTSGVGGAGWFASVAAYKELLSTNVAPYRPLDTVPNYIGVGTTVSTPTGTVADINYGFWGNFGGNTLSGTTGNRRFLHAPKRIKRYATEKNPVWSYFTPETAGTDKYGFSILPAGMRGMTLNYTAFIGEAAGFWSASFIVNPLPLTFNTSTYQRTTAPFRIFMYNLQLNAVMPHAIFSAGYWVSSIWYEAFTTGLSVRCLAKKRN
jgi:hypothetical protein